MEFDLKQIAENLKNQSYAYLGAGSGRRVFDLGDGYVVKVAMNRKGIAQNKTEYDISKAGASDMFARIAKVSEHFDLLIMEKAEKLTDFSVVWKHFNVTNHRELFKLKEFRDLLNTYTLVPNDFARKDSWGTINGRPVIIDYGFTVQVRNRYYSPF